MAGRGATLYARARYHLPLVFPKIRLRVLAHFHRVLRFLIYCVQAGRALTPKIRRIVTGKSISNLPFGQTFMHTAMCLALGLFTVILGLFIGYAANPLLAAFATVLALVCLLFGYLLPTPTKHGRDALDDIERLRRYLVHSSEQANKYLVDKKDTAETFKRYLPYAIALEVDDSWHTQFAEALHTAFRPNHKRGTPNANSSKIWFYEFSIIPFHFHSHPIAFHFSI